MKKFLVITTINSITKGIKKFSEMRDWEIIIVADKKTPNIDESENFSFLSLQKQAQLDFQSYEECRFDHYARKNLGYLYAFKNGASLIADSDDDNIPYNNWFETFFPKKEDKVRYLSAKGVINVYKYFTSDFIWPRGFPLSKIRNQPKISNLRVEKSDKNILIRQGLVDKNPDVDAIFRLIFPEETYFENKPILILKKGLYSPFNSQNTIWHKDAFPYMYLPLHVNFRFTDILRSYIAQRGIWEMNSYLSFVSPSAYQDRNPHDLMKDFEDEIPSYLVAEKLIDILNKVDLVGKPLIDLLKIYKTLYNKNIVKFVEIEGVKAWVNDISKINQERNI